MWLVRCSVFFRFILFGCFSLIVLESDLCDIFMLKWLLVLVIIVMYVFWIVIELFNVMFVSGRLFELMDRCMFVLVLLLSGEMVLIWLIVVMILVNISD